MKLDASWLPVLILGTGVLLLTGGVREQIGMPLRAPLDAVVPMDFQEYAGRDIDIPEEEQQVAGMSNYLMRVYSPPDDPELPLFSVYVGYYERQFQGKTIHSPRNCLPGGGWEPLTSSREDIATGLGAVTVNRYLIGNGAARAIVLYWYQGRGRVEANEYLVKWHLLHDQARYGRSDEALVRVIVPVTESEEDAYGEAVRIAAGLVPLVDHALPPPS